MARLGHDPVPSSPEVALPAFETDLATVLHGKTAAEVGWQRPDPLTLLIPMWATIAADAPDLYLLKLQFGYYPEWPASAQFVNPLTRAYNAEIDIAWLPRIENNSRIQVHAKYDWNGRKIQLICSSTTLEFYQVRHGGKEGEVWNHNHQNFFATISEIKAGLFAPFYRGRMQ
jgi:hypothetical protein